MKKVFKNSSEVCHKFASQSQYEGRCSNVYFHGDNIYSYGSHFCMARVLSPGKVLITDRTYSVTTAKHLSEIRYALNHYERLFVPHPESGFEDNMKVWARRIQDQFNILNNSRKRPETKEKAKNELAYIVKTIEDYQVWTGNKMYSSDKEALNNFVLLFNAAKGTFPLEELNAKLEKRRKLNEATNKRRQKELQKKQQVLFNRWLLGQSDDDGRTIHVRYLTAVDQVGLRCVDGETVETSKGVNVSLKAAKVLFERIQQGKDVKGFDIDGYTVLSLNGVLTIGCHKIERSEINRFAKTQGWI